MNKFEYGLLSVPAIILLAYIFFIRETFETSGPIWTIGGLLFILGVNFVAWWRIKDKLKRKK